MDVREAYEQLSEEEKAKVRHTARVMGALGEMNLTPEVMQNALQHMFKHYDEIMEAEPLDVVIQFPGRRVQGRRK